MSATATQERDKSAQTEQPVALESKPLMFVDQGAFESWLKMSKTAAHKVGVEKHEWPDIEKVLRERFGQGLPRSRVKGAIFRD